MLELNILAQQYLSGAKKEDLAIRLATVCADLMGKSIEEVRHACKRWRTNGDNRWFPTSGQLLDLMKNPYADPPTAHRGNDWHTRLGFGGGACKCQKCTEKKHRDGFFVAPPEDYRRDEATRKELRDWLDYEIERRFGPSRLTEDEMHKRFLMTQELVRDHGMEWEHARRKVMVQRTREQHPEITIWPTLGNEPDTAIQS